jgi:hypothetical protein
MMRQLTAKRQNAKKSKRLLGSSLNKVIAVIGIVGLVIDIGVLIRKFRR